MRSAAIIGVAALCSAALAAEPVPEVVCNAQLMPPATLQDYFPPGPRRRSETGAVTLELTISVSAKLPLDVRISKSSGFPDLDAAALRIGKALLVTTDCLNSTVLRAIHFEKEPDPPRSTGTDAIFRGETHIWVEEL